MALVEKRREVLAMLGSESIRHEQLRQVLEVLCRLFPELRPQTACFAVIAQRSETRTG
jgi:hypothetical protein